MSIKEHNFFQFSDARFGIYVKYNATELLGPEAPISLKHNLQVMRPKYAVEVDRSYNSVCSLTVTRPKFAVKVDRP